MSDDQRLNEMVDNLAAKLLLAGVSDMVHRLADVLEKYSNHDSRKWAAHLFQGLELDARDKAERYGEASKMRPAEVRAEARQTEILPDISKTAEFLPDILEHVDEMVAACGLQDE